MKSLKSLTIIFESSLHVVKNADQKKSKPFVNNFLAHHFRYLPVYQLIIFILFFFSS
jgi:hypothetical protein